MHRFPPPSDRTESALITFTTTAMFTWCLIVSTAPSVMSSVMSSAVVPHERDLSHGGALDLQRGDVDEPERELVSGLLDGGGIGLAVIEQRQRLRQRVDEDRAHSAGSERSLHHRRHHRRG